MANYKCAKPIKIGGKPYRVGDAIPDGAIEPNNVKSLLSGRYIAEIGDHPPDATKHTNEQDDAPTQPLKHVKQTETPRRKKGTQ